MQHLEVSCAVRPIVWPLGVKWLSVYDCSLPSSRTAASPHLQQYHVCGVLRRSSTANSSSADDQKLSSNIMEQHGDNSSPAHINHAFINTYWRWIYIGCGPHTLYTWRGHPSYIHLWQTTKCTILCTYNNTGLTPTCFGTNVSSSGNTQDKFNLNIPRGSSEDPRGWFFVILP